MIVGIEYKKKFEFIWNKLLLVNHDGINYGKIIANELTLFCHSDIPSFKETKTYNSRITTVFKRLIKGLLFKQIKSPYFFPGNELPNTSKTILFFHEEDGRKDYKDRKSVV